ncbi:MAG: cupredoxin domain-containing protein [Acidobacteriaceae bacterium]
MNGFRIWTAADNGADLHSKGRGNGGAKAARAVMLGTGLLFLMIGCGKKTPSYAGPPDTVRQIVMKKWEIEPGRVEVPQGARVELVVTSTDVEHGIAVPGLGINEPVQPEHPAVIRFLAQTPGVYPMRCSVLCGRGHNQMTGVIVITRAGSR